MKSNLRQCLTRWLLRTPAALQWWELAAQTRSALAGMRREYRLSSLDEQSVAADPILQFEKWLSEAVAAKMPEPNAMVLATADTQGSVSARTVLLKDVDARGFAFFSNYESRKARELAENPQAGLLFVWLPLERQVEVKGRVEKLARAETEQYFETRPLASRLGAWASPQSRVLKDRVELEARVNAAITRFRSEPLVAPSFWGGYRVIPATLEFWQGRPGRLHDRLRYTRATDGSWKIERLAP
jgi:pyridoxamine 5'-phosphate oxidase